MDSPETICQYAFGTSPNRIGEIVVIMKTDMTEQYRGAFDKGLHELKGGVFSGITGLVSDKEVSAIYSKGPGDIADCVSFLGMSGSRCHTVISTGTVGGLNPSMEMGDFFIAEEAVGMDGYSLFIALKNKKPIQGHFSNRVHPIGNLSACMEPSFRGLAAEYGVNFHKGKVCTVPGISLEKRAFLEETVHHGCVAIDMRTSSFYAASGEYGFNSLSFSWITDLPFTRNIFHRFHNPEESQKDFERKHPIWLNLAKIVTKGLRRYIGDQRANVHEKPEC